MVSVASAIHLLIVPLALACLCYMVWHFWTCQRQNTKSSILQKYNPTTGIDVKTIVPRPYRPWKAGKFHMTMGLQKMPEDDWLLLDRCYLEEQELRRELLDNCPEEVMQVLPDSHDACVETLEMMVAFFTTRYPQHFSFADRSRHYIHNHLTDKVFRIVEPFDEQPLAVAAQLCMEDMNLMIQGAGDDPEEHYLRASYSMAPAGWYLKERIGWPLWRIHGPVPLWQQKLRKAVEKFFTGLKVDSPVQRTNFFMQVGRNIFQQEPFPTSSETRCKIEDVVVRHERQTLRRLPRSQAVLFTVRTYLTHVVALADEPQSLHNLRAAAREMPAEMGHYKGRGVWGEVLEEYCEKMLGPWSDEKEVT